MRSPLQYVLTAVVLAATTNAMADVDLIIAPTCPTAASSVALTAVQGTNSPSLETLLSVSQDSDHVLKVVVRVGNTFTPGAPPSSVTANLGTLPAGDYHVGFYTRLVGSTEALGPEVLTGYTNFRVETGPAPCKAWNIAATDGNVQSTLTRTQFGSPVTVRVTDSIGNPVTGAEVNVSRVALSWDYPGASASSADASLSAASVATDANGLAVIAAKANGSVGSYQYAATVTHANVSRSAYVVLSNRASAETIVVAPVVEYYNTLNGHYFMTMNPAETSALDDGTTKGWIRTGAVFLAYPPGSTVLTGKSPVCRFYGKPEAGLDSHFFSASPKECAEVAEQFGYAWTLETNEAFNVFLPGQATGSCDGNSAPLFRVFNSRADANHRYLRTLEAVKQMTASGWIPEGYGPNAVAMCVPQ